LASTTAAACSAKLQAEALSRFGEACMAAEKDAKKAMPQTSDISRLIDGR
jgi:hypothetical protein